ncbi:mucosa-associated lymphoid tissue lymphoma translocation protein 1 isoform X3 [Manacus vitellinus]|uniref:mucosa-associated lymphoid tissue lymphoma translocation protein 1 isoform X3 n=1 Tax=Manacus vitellinus TaxID=328815 RepID=UPI00115D4172|nr:mucosa-associated lymphoid tissue lymphoma translocation protein 1 isoform X3 [Manacus vitellinus]
MDATLVAQRALGCACCIVSTSTPCFSTAITITEQPVSISVPVGYSFTLRCRAEGSTLLQYQWFCQHQSDCHQIPGATNPDLPIIAEQTQLYTCRVNDLYRNAVFSDWVKVEVHQCVARGLPPRLWRGEPVIILNPMEQRVEVGKPLQLQCAAMGVPAPCYQWYRNGNLLEQHKRKKLWITHAKVSDSGTYLCCASNSHGEHWTNAVDVHVGTCGSEKFFATGKIALLVGNNRYQHHPNLMAPVKDVFELSRLLEQLGFQVVSLLDLNKAEMATAVSQFLQLLEKGVYAVFYYAGHGYEHLGRNYMVPVDAPQPYSPENCISVQRILQKMQQQQTALNIILLDTCRKWYNPGRALSQVQPLEPWGNTVYGYATSEDAEAYELQDGEFSSGIFMKYLKKHILKEKKVTHMLEDVLEDVGRDPLVTGKQVMEIKHTLKEARSLTDPICPSGAGAERWGHSHEPLSRTLTFPCGARAELRFLRLFSNLMSVCAKLQAPPAHVTAPRLLLCQPPEMEAVAMQRESRLDHVETLLASVYKWEELDCVFQLCGLQKIQHPGQTSHPRITVCLLTTSFLICSLGLHSSLCWLEGWEGRSTQATAGNAAASQCCNGSVEPISLLRCRESR